MFALTITSAAGARRRRSPHLRPRPPRAQAARARVAGCGSESRRRTASPRHGGHAVTARRGALFGAAAAALAFGAPSPRWRSARCRGPLLALPAEQRADATLRLIAQTSALVEGADGAVDIEGWLAASSAWSGLAPSMYSPQVPGQVLPDDHQARGVPAELVRHSARRCARRSTSRTRRSTKASRASGVWRRFGSRPGPCPDGVRAAFARPSNEGDKTRP